MKFLLDENVHRALFYFIKQLRYDIKLCPRGISNGSVLRICMNEERILLTRDLDFLKNIPLDYKHPGIIILKISPEDIESQKSAILNLFKGTRDFSNKIIELYNDRYEVKTK
jgi:predicted nuclease of predicted toxin-antitoxin system